MVTETTGRDPLGLSRVSFIVTDYLLTGIITQTDRARYYSFYCWALWHISNVDNPKRYQDFVDGFRRREAVIALATISNNPETPPVGVTAASAQLERGTADGNVNCDFRVLPSNPLGGYGQYYGGSLYQLGLTYRSEDGIDRVTEGKALCLAQIFHSHIEKTPYIRKSLFGKTFMALDDLRKSQKRLTLDGLWEPFAKSEREELIELFFDFEGRVPNERTILRRSTLGLILHAASEYEKAGFPSNMKELDWCLVFPTYYFNVLWLSEDVARPYSCPKQFLFCRGLWKQFCVQQFLTQAIEGLLYSVLETAGAESSGLTMDAIISTILQVEFFSILEETVNASCRKPHDLLSALGIESLPDRRKSSALQEQLPLLDPKSEARIMALEHNNPQRSASRAILMLSVLYGKWRGMESDAGFGYVATHAGSELWIGTSLSDLDVWLESETDWESTLQNLVSKWILDQHDRIMYEKRRLDSCWVRRAEGRIFKDQDYGPRLRSSRHYNAVSILRDLGLLEIDGDGHILLTDEGAKILEKVLA